MNTLERLLRYDPTNRYLKTRDLIEGPLAANEIKDLVVLLEGLASEVYKCNHAHLLHRRRFFLGEPAHS